MRTRALLFSTLLAAATLPGVVSADEVPRELLLRFNELVQSAERVEASDGTEAAIVVYRDALVDLSYGRIHLRLARLHQKLDQLGEAAHHFRACTEDARVDETDRELFCQDGFAQTTAVLNLAALPERGQIHIVAPATFAGPIESGQRVPLGPIDLRVEAPGREPSRVRVQVDGPTTWTVELGEAIGESGDVPLHVSSGFVEDDPFLVDDDYDEPSAGGPTRWPAYTAAATGLALVAAGVFVGSGSLSDLDDIRSRQATAGECPSLCVDELDDAHSRAQMGDALLISGVVVAASSAVLWYLFDEDGDGDHDDGFIAD